MDLDTTVPAPIPEGAWASSRVPFRFALSDFPIATIRLPLAVRKVGEAEAPLAKDAIARLPELLDRFPSGVLLRSYPVAESLPPLSRINGALCYVPRQYRRYYIDLTGTFEAYQAKFSSKSRSTIRRKLRKFSERSGGAIDWREYRTPEDVRTFHRLAREVSALTYQERLLDTGLPASSEFIENAVKLAAQDRVRAYLLFLDGKPISYLYCPVEDGVLIYQFLGYDPAYASLSPGTVLQWCVVESLFAEGRFRAFDFTEGEGDHKRFFATDSSRRADVVVLRATLSNRCFVRLHRGCDEFSVRCGRLLDRFGLKARMRRLLRR
jgi:CelD/BcsL family acetyltransferase involved in cellulose biosynthesis